MKEKNSSFEFPTRYSTFCTNSFWKYSGFLKNGNEFVFRNNAPFEMTSMFFFVDSCDILDRRSMISVFFFDEWEKCQ